MEKIKFHSYRFWELKDLFMKGFFKEKTIFNFLNSQSIYCFKTKKEYREVILRPHNFNFIDGGVISLYLRGKRLRGPSFTDSFIRDKDLVFEGKHFFIGYEKKDLDYICKKYKNLDRKKVFCYNPPYIKGINFSKEEIAKISKLVNSKKVDYVWVGVGSPKQEILSNAIYPTIKTKFIFNIGAALDFIADKKSEAPEITRRMYLEWLYRFITDFKYSRKKVWQSVIGTVHMFWSVKK